jgi:hypothetical protein
MFASFTIGTFSASLGLYKSIANVISLIRRLVNLNQHQTLDNSKKEIVTYILLHV